MLRLKIRLVPARRYVHLTHRRFSEPREYFESLAQICDVPGADFLDGTIFGRQEMYVTRGEFRERSAASERLHVHGYLLPVDSANADDWLTSKDYIWRWDTDWFWCSKHFGVQEPAIRFFAKWALNSHTYQRLMRVSQKLLPDSPKLESVIQDVQIPINARLFVTFFFARSASRRFGCVRFETPRRRMIFVG